MVTFRTFLWGSDTCNATHSTKMAQPLVFAVHAVFFLMYAYTLWYDLVYVDISGRGYGGKFKFLTFLCLVSIIVY